MGDRGTSSLDLDDIPIFPLTWSQYYLVASMLLFFCLAATGFFCFVGESMSSNRESIPVWGVLVVFGLALIVPIRILLDKRFCCAYIGDLRQAVERVNHYRLRQSGESSLEYEWRQQHVSRCIQESLNRISWALHLAVAGPTVLLLSAHSLFWPNEYPVWRGLTGLVLLIAAVSAYLIMKKRRTIEKIALCQ